MTQINTMVLLEEEDPPGTGKEDHDDQNDDDAGIVPEQPQPQRRRRKVLGRTGQRRRKKRLDIQAELQRLLLQQQQQQQQQQNTTTTSADDDNNSGDNTATLAAALASSTLPSDRNKIWPAVWEIRQRRSDDHGWNQGNDDSMALVQQLGYVPGNVIDIPTRVYNVPALLLLQKNMNTTEHDHHPVVVKLYPIVWRKEHKIGKGRKRHKHNRVRMMINTGDNGSGDGGTMTIVVRDDDDDDEAADNNTENQNNASAAAVTAGSDSSNSSHNSSSGSSGSNNNNKQQDDDDNHNKYDNNMCIEPFPTLYWVTHPLLRCQISKLELDGYGSKLKQRLDNDDDFLQRMKRAHELYGQERWDTLTETDVNIIRQLHWEHALMKTKGIAGCRNPAAVKCLHAHAAHYLSGGPGASDNVIGQWVMEEIVGRYSSPE